ncbi:MAG: PilZ domain-containing protein [Pseudomonadota bacterium]
MSVAGFIQDQYSERREHARRKCSMQANIIMGGSVISKCIVKDISLKGARLVFQNGRWVPSRFQLQLPDGLPPIDARRIWSEKDAMGILFEI